MVSQIFAQDDVGSAVDFAYKPPFKFTGRIDNVTIELK